jgi:signal transduction histidine kinase
MEINLYTISSLINAVVSLIVGLLILLKSKRSEVSRDWFLLCLNVTLWSISMAIICSVSNEEHKLIAFYFSYGAIFFAICVPLLFIRFIASYLNIWSEERRVLKIAHMCWALILLTFCTPWYLTGIRPVGPFKYFVKAGPLFGLHVINFYFWGIYAHYLMIKYSGKANHIEKKQLKWLFISTLTGYVLGSITFIPCFGINMDPWPYHFTWVYLVLILYASLRHQLMDVSIVIRKALVFALLFAFAAGMFAVTAYGVQGWLAGHLNIDSRILYGFTIFLIILTFKPLENFLTEITQKFLFQRKYDSKKILKEFSILSSVFFSHDELVKKAEEVILNSLNLDCVLIQLNSRKHEFKPGGFVVAHTIPIQDQNQHWGSLLLGNKRSGEPYTDEDLDFLSAFASQLAASLRNIRSLEQATQAQAEVQQASKMATVGILAASINHEVRNPLYVAKGELESYLMNVEQGNGMVQEAEAIKQEAVRLMKNSIKQIDRATSIMQSLSNFSKPSSKVETQSVSIKETIENVLSLIKHEFKYNETLLRVDIPKDLPSLQMNPRHLEEILFNLLTNALHAVENKNGSRVTIKAHTSLQVEAMRKVIIEISDTGSGISSENLSRIWEPFFTTKGDKGTGLGLYVTKKLVEANQGIIEVESVTSKGTSFRIVFPIVNIQDNRVIR